MKNPKSKLGLQEIEALVKSGKINDLSEYEIKEIAAALDKLLSTDFRDYVPHTKQKLFHSSTQHIRLILGGNRSGKTTAGIHEDLFHATGLYPDWYPKEKHIMTPNKGRIVATDFTKGVGEVIVPKIKELLPINYITKIQKNPQGTPIKYIFKNGSTIDILTHEQDTKLFEGWSGHWVHFDEPPPRDKYIACSRGLVDFNGRCWFTLTPLNEPWIYDELYDNPDDNIFTITVDILDNSFLPGGIEAVKEFAKKLTDDEKEARLHGKFLHLTGLVYKKFDKTVHVINPFNIPSDWRRVMVIDPHDRRPHAVTWYAVDPMDTIYFYDELEFAGTIKELVQVIRAKEDGRRIDLRIIDPNKGRTPTIVTGKRLVDEFATHGLRFISKINDNITEGHLVVNKYLEWDTSKPLSEVNKPKVYFFNTVKKTIYGLTHYMWDEFRNKDTKDSKEKPKDKYKDFPDCIRYGLIIQPKYAKPSPYIAKRKSIYKTGY